MEKNRKRLLEILHYLIKYTNEDKRVTCFDIITHLEKAGINNTNRKTIYEDIKVLNDFGLDIEYDGQGYYLLEAPFSLAEIKLIQDSLYSLKNLDINLLNKLNEKLYSFISFDEEKLLNDLSFNNLHKDKKLLHRLELILEAIKDKKAVIVKRKNKENELIFPLYLHRNNDYYYFYYHYPNNKKIYHFRFDNILDLSICEQLDDIVISKSSIIEHINESSNSFYKGKSENVTLIILKNHDYLIERILDDFPNAIKTKEGISLKVNVNNIFFSKIVEYGKSVLIKEKNVAKEFNDYLKNIIKNYRPEK